MKAVAVYSQTMLEELSNGKIGKDLKEYKILFRFLVVNKIAPR
jgi:hypothetical protein